MKINKFDVVELKDKNKATILSCDDKQYYAEIVDNQGNKIENAYIKDINIERIIYKNKINKRERLR